ncbi:hypothetical protein BDV93DRAFT_612002 [Ceratobasidium sp. AG-I]|nr:hypothetical protein BDV93DRAFT_612002 [Ceratobasidium sp. AG-I]
MAGRLVDQSPRPFRGPWEGEIKIVIGIDVGSTESSVAFTFLQQGVNWTVHHVTQWPGQTAHQNKVPSLVWYDSDKKAVSFGAEASPKAEESAWDNRWSLAKRFKLHLNPIDRRCGRDSRLDPLPLGVSLLQVYTDFLGYLLPHIKLFFEDQILDGEQIWSRYQPEMEVVIAHPNNWGIREQTFLRHALIGAGLADTASAPGNIRFMTEAEASAYFCIYHTNLEERLKAGMNFVVCDAGGSTVDTTVYSVTSAQPILKLEEKCASACIQAGGIFVDAAVEKYLCNVFRNTKLSPEDVDEYTRSGVKDFESFTKRTFCDPEGEYKVMIAGTRFHNAATGTRRMDLSGQILKSFFNPHQEN